MHLPPRHSSNLAHLKSLARIFTAGAVLLLTAACSDDSGKGSAPSFSAGVGKVTRQVLAESTSDTAPGQVVQLTRVIVPAGQRLTRHTHPGPQLAVIAEGTLTYTVYSGTVRLTRAAGLANSRTETVTAGQSVELKPGDSVVETPGMVHDSRNVTDKAVIIYLSTLFPAGAPASAPAD